MFKNILNRIKLFFQSGKEFYWALYKLTGFLPGNINLYQEALVHKSSSKEDKTGRYRNNERLEFLGDAIFDSIIAETLYKKFPDRNEGFLTNTRSKIVKRETMDRVADQLGLNKLLVSSMRTKTTKNHIAGNALEAFIGAVYLDQGYARTRRFVENKLIAPYIDIEVLARKEVNFKSKLLEWCQKSRVTLDFPLIESYKDDYRNPVFKSEVLLNGVQAGEGTGYSKKESQQYAAQKALTKIKADKQFVEEIWKGCSDLFVPLQAGGK